MSSQCMFGNALAREAVLGLNFWNTECPPVEGVSLTVRGPDGATAVKVASRLDVPAQSVDQRVKVPRWIAEFEKRGGIMVYRDAGIDDLEHYAERSDLVLVASGKSDIA